MPPEQITDQPPPQPNDGTPIADLVIDDIHTRKQVGIARYGVPLQSHNGRDALVNAYQEAMDLTLYLRQALAERVAPVEVLEDALCRRVWVAALRWEAGNTLLREGEREILASNAAGIESGALTPWADDPEPATQPAERHTQPPADLDPHPDTPQRCATCNTPIIHSGGERYWHLVDGFDDDIGPHPARPAEQHPDTPPHASGILGRALLDHDGDVWQQRSDGGYELAGSGMNRTREWAERHYGPVREVLLVDPAAAHVIQAAQQWRNHRSDRWGSVSEVYANACAHLAVAVDALTGGPETQVATGPDPEPAGDGPGWDRPGIEAARRFLPPGLANQVGALLADHVRVAAERLREHNRAERAEHERDAACSRSYHG